MKSVIYTQRFYLRELTDEDVSEKYLMWLHDEHSIKWIMTAENTEHLSELKKYIHERIGREDILFLGIFDKYSDEHIGNIKYEPVNTELGYAIMGVLIGDSNYRGKGVFVEAFNASAKWLKQNRNINQIVLGVNEDNISAIHAYEKAGFIAKHTPYIKINSSSGITMVWEER